MNRTTSSRRKRWFFSRSLARAYQAWLEKRKRNQSAALQRPLFAEALEPRVLFSGAPVPAEQEVEAQANEQQPSAQTAELIVPQALPPQFESGIDGIENVLMEQEAAQEAEADFTGEDMASFALESLTLGSEAGLTPEQLAELERFQYGVDAGGDGAFAAGDDSAIDLELDEEELNWLIDEEADWQDDALAGYDGFLEELTDEAIDGIDLLTSVMYEQGQIVGLEDIQDVSEIDGLIQPEIAVPTAQQDDQQSIALVSYEIHGELVIDDISLREAIDGALADDLDEPALDGDAVPPVAVVEEPVFVAAEVSSVLLNVEQTPTATSGATLTLTRAQVEALAFVAAQRWSAAGITDEQRELLRSISYDVRDLDGNRIGVANGLGITIDLDAAGQGWFVDETPLEDTEFGRALSATNLFATDAAAAAGFDLLTTIMHEQGHILGLLDNYDEQGNLMYGFIETGQRRLSEMDQADGAIAGSHHGDEYLTAALFWTGAFDTNAADARNWAGGVAPSTMDDLVFAGTGAGTIDFSGFAPGTRFNSIMITGSGYTLTGNSIELYGGLSVNNTTGTNTVALDITLINAQTIMNANVGSTLNITGPIHTGALFGSTNVFGTSALTFDGAGATNVSGVIDGAGSLNKLGSGTLTLSVANTYEGITDVRQGVIVVSHSNALGNATTGHVRIQPGASLHVTGGVSIANALSISEGGVGFGNGTDLSTLGALRSLVGTNTWTGNIDFAGDNNLIGVNTGGTLNLTGVISNSLSRGSNLYKVGEGTLQLTGTQANVYRGTTRVLQGTLELGKTAGLDAVGGSVVIGDDIEASGTKTLRLLAANQIRHLDQYDTGVLTVTVGSTGVFDLNGFSDTIGNVTLTNGVTQSSVVDLGGATLTMQGSTLTVNGFQGSSGVSPTSTIIDGTFNIGTLESTSGIAAVIAGGSASKFFVINDTQVANMATDLHISANIVGASDVSITRSGGGTLRLSGNNSALTGPYIMNGGIDEIASNNAYGTGVVSLQNDGNTLKAVGARTLANTIHLNGNIITLGDNLTFDGNVTMSGSRIIYTMDAAQTVTINGVIDEAFFGNLTLTKSGRGTLVLTAANTYSGQTVIADDGGTMILRGNGSILNSFQIIVRDAATLRLDNTATNLPNRIDDRTLVVMEGGDLHLIANAAGTTETIGFMVMSSDLSSGLITDSTLGNSHVIIQRSRLDGNADLALTALGTALSIAGPNRVTFGEIPVNEPMNDGVAARLTVRGPGGLGMATFASVTEGLAAIALSPTDYITDINQAGPVSNVRLAAGVHTLTTSRTINSLYLEDGAILNGAGFALLVESGAVILGAGSTVNVETLNLGGRTYLTAASGTATINSTIIGAGSAFSKIGLGKLVFTGDNQIGGPVFINEGILNVQRSTAFGSTAQATAVRAGATLELEQTTFGAVNVTVEGLTLEGSGFNDTGAIRNVSGNNSWAGNVAQAGPNTNLNSLLGGFPVFNPGQVRYQVETGSSLNLSGGISGGVEVIKTGGGTLEFSGVIPNTFTNATTRVLEGTLFLNKEPGINALPNDGTNREILFIGAGTGVSTATLRLGGGDQISDPISVRVNKDGILDLNGNSEVIAPVDSSMVVSGQSRHRVTIGTGT